MTVELTKIEKDANFNFMEITFLTKVEKSILNAAGTSGGNLTELKKTTEIDGSQRIFVSGTSLKWSIKKYWQENQEQSKEFVSPIVEKAAGAQISSKCDLENYIDDDLFGYMNTANKLARYAPVKTNGMISLFNVGPDVDNLTRYSPKSQDHSLFDKEVSTNVFRSSWVVELDGIGITRSKKELSKGRQVNLSKEKKEHRIKLFLEAIFNLWHRTQQSNYLTNTQPELLTVIFRSDKSPIIGDKLRINDQYEVEIEPLKEILTYHQDKISLAYIGAHKSFIKNFDKLETLTDDPNFLKDKLFVSNLTTIKEKFLSKEFDLIRINKNVK